MGKLHPIQNIFINNKTKDHDRKKYLFLQRSG